MRVRRNAKKIYQNEGKDKLLPRLSLFMFDHKRVVAVAWILLTVFGVLSYTTFMKREGFPKIDIPFTVANGTYFVNDAAKLDEKVTVPLGKIAQAIPGVASVNTFARDNFYSVLIQYKDGVDSAAATRDFTEQAKKPGVLPTDATFTAQSPRMGFNARGDDSIISLYAMDDSQTVDSLTAEAEKLLTYLKDQHITGIKTISVVKQFESGVNPLTGQTVRQQTSFDRYGFSESGQVHFYRSVAIGYQLAPKTDLIKVNDQVEAAVSRYNQSRVPKDMHAVVSATFARDIQSQISELQKSLLEGLLAVLIVGSIVIVFRATLVIILAMVTVLVITVGMLNIFGYTLNTITLFSLVLCLGLIVDDTIIMTEAIDAQRRRLKNRREIIAVATRKVSRAMLAATLTAALCFAPLLFITGLMGGFVRAVPVTIITSLMVSLLVALIFIPFFAGLILITKKHTGPEVVHEFGAAFEEKVARGLSRPVLWARHSRKKLFAVGTVALILSLVFISAGGWLFQKVGFNIFPPTKDSNALVATLEYAPGTSIDEATRLADIANKTAATSLKDNLTAGYYATAGDRSTMLMLNLKPYSKRSVKAPQLQAQFQKDLAAALPKTVSVSLRQIDVGPPPTDLNVQINATNRPAALRLADDVQKFLQNKELTRTSGEKAKIVEAAVADPNMMTRKNSRPYVQVTGKFNATDSTTLLALAQDVIKKEYTPARLASFGLPADAIKFDLEQEQNNQDSFKTLMYALPFLLLAIYLLLAVQFRSLLQPLLIFMALPFSLFGIALGLYLTNNVFSFFAMLGFFALIGLSIKNTILLTDYANQLRRTGKSAVDSAVGALAERFRPLIATSLTAVVSLVPLAVTSPFWEGLAVVLIFGLLSSTLMVVTVFPYFYLGSEYLRQTVRRRDFFGWLLLTLIVAYVVWKLGVNGGLALLVSGVGVLVLQLVVRRLRRR